MKILFLCTAFNSLSQRVALVLRSHGHAVTVELALSPELMISAAELACPDIIICPFLTKRVPPVIYNRWLTLIVHPGPPGDAGPSALDWTLFGDLGEYGEAEAELNLINASHNATSTQVRRKMRSHWGVTVLQAIEAFDAGPVWAFDQFELDEHTSQMSKSDLYRGPVTRAAVNAVLSAIEVIKVVACQQNGEQVYSVDLKAPEFTRACCVSKGRPFLGGQTHDRPLLKASSRDFFQFSINQETRLNADTVVQRIRCGDSQPGVLTNLFGTPLFVYNAVVQQDPLPKHVLERSKTSGPGTILATRDGAILVEVGAEHPIWISHLRRPKSKSDKYLHPKLPATMALMSIPDCATRLGLLSEVKEWDASEGEDVDPALPWQRRKGTYQQVWVELELLGDCDSKIGYIHSEFYNGAFSTTQCEMLLKAIDWTLTQSNIKAIVMLGGSGYFSNGISLNVIEGSDDPSAEGWANINAIDDCVQALLAPAGVVTFAAIRGNAAAGGLALATAADVVLCAETAVLNPHYRGIGLYGSEWHTYSWYERCGADVASQLTHQMLPISSKDAHALGLVDHVIENDTMSADRLLIEIKSIVRGIMTADAADSNKHIGAPWTRPLRPIFGNAQVSLPEYMLRSKTKYLAYLFAGNGQDHLSLEQHFQTYRNHELEQMTLDFFHPHRSHRFLTRCTAFVRKLVPTTTPFRFALHRRCEGGSWPGVSSSATHKDEEELDDFDGLGEHPASCAVPRLPKRRPEYIQKVSQKGEQEPRPEMSRTGSISSAKHSLYSDSTPALSTSSPASPTSADVQLFNLDASAMDEVTQALAGKEIDRHTVAVDQDQPVLVSPVQIPEIQDAKTVPTSVLLPERNHSGEISSQEPQILWSCYYSENGSGNTAIKKLEDTSEALDNMMRTN